MPSIERSILLIRVVLICALVAAYYSHMGAATLLYCKQLSFGRSSVSRAAYTTGQLYVLTLTCCPRENGPLATLISCVGFLTLGKMKGLHHLTESYSST